MKKRGEKSVEKVEIKLDLCSTTFYIYQVARCERKKMLGKSEKKAEENLENTEHV